jgi:hypothetical protein
MDLFKSPSKMYLDETRQEVRQVGREGERNCSPNDLDSLNLYIIEKYDNQY